MKLSKLPKALPALALMVSAGTASAAPVTPDIIFGSGNDNGSFTVTTTTLSFPSNPTAGDIELGLRAKLRYDDTSGCIGGFGCPQNLFNWDGVDTYSFNLANSNSPLNRAMWNYEWSVNVDDVNATLPDLASVGSLILAYDTDPTAGTNFEEYNVFDVDAYYGTNATANGGGTYVPPGGAIPAGSTVAQNSVNYGFIPGAPLGAGLFDIKLTALSSGGVELASTGISVNVSPIPLPAALPLLLLGLGGLGLMRRRKNKTA